MRATTNLHPKAGDVPKARVERLGGVPYIVAELDNGYESDHCMFIHDVEYAELLGNALLKGARDLRAARANDEYASSFVGGNPGPTDIAPKEVHVMLADEGEYAGAFIPGADPVPFNRPTMLPAFAWKFQTGDGS